MNVDRSNKLPSKGVSKDIGITEHRTDSVGKDFAEGKLSSPNNVEHQKSGYSIHTN